ncbi:Xyloglucanase Xgh74A [Geodia barretti]|uniref:Xyloglucanase Xgh74A n=1 Tax=Geodia barretti TaxID=519541 RepID=A0AA35WAC0_GEOBA|nr:Xyloglucanase Xgh74A [Geodia barretti]
MHDGVCAVISDDGGKSWQQGPVKPLAHAAARLSASPVARSRAYLAAYEAGVYRTDDGGITWDHLGSYPTEYAHSVLAHPDDGEAVYVGSEPAEIWRSADCGATWDEFDAFRAVPEATQWGFHSPTRDSHVRDLRAAPGSVECLYAGIEVGGMVRSGDGGSSWKQLSGLNDDIHCVNLSANRADRIYVATAVSPYRSDDGGETWEMINVGLDRRYALHIAAAPDDADLVLVTVSENARRGNPKFYRSTDAGRSWDLVPGVGEGENPTDMMVAFDWDPQEPNTVYGGTDGGKLYRSADRGATWEALPVDVGTVAVGALAVSSD